eukprot:1939088-Pleurochrysis_carterae.AAC.1
MTLASSPRGSGTWPVERRRDGGPDVEAVGCVIAGGCATDDGEERAELVNVRLRAGLHLVGRHVRDSASGPLVSNALWMDTIWLIAQGQSHSL